MLQTVMSYLGLNCLLTGICMQKKKEKRNGDSENILTP